MEQNSRVDLLAQALRSVPAPFAKLTLLAVRPDHWKLGGIPQTDVERLWLRLMRRWLAMPLEDKLVSAKAYLDSLGLPPTTATERMIVSSLSQLVPPAASIAERASFLEHGKIVFQMLLDEDRETSRVRPK